jgi:hypothetical protein
MSNTPIAFYVVGALFTLYVVAARWRSKKKQGTSYTQSNPHPLRSRSVSADRRVDH